MGWALWHITFNPTAKNAEAVKASSVYIPSSRLDTATQWRLVSKKTKIFFTIYFNIFRKFGLISYKQFPLKHYQTKTKELTVYRKLFNNYNILNIYLSFQLIE